MKSLAYWLSPALISVVVLGSLAGQKAKRGTEPGPFTPPPSDIAKVTGYPSIGKWMISPNMTYADWRGETYEGKKLREPINVVIVDPLARSEDDAIARFLASCTSSGFASRTGHSGGYSAWLGDELYTQTPPARHHAVSDKPFEFHNNHGRFFGPHFWRGRYYFIGALSREKIGVKPEPEHVYVSFNQARDRFAHALEQKGEFKITAFISLENAILNDQQCGTGDHDGVAVVLTAVK